jgi:hypothetical protein
MTELNNRIIPGIETARHDLSQPHTEMSTVIAPIDRARFFVRVRSRGYFKILRQQQVEGFDAIFDEWERQQLEDKRWLAYMLATVFHETDQTMQPIEEYGKGKGHKYGKKIKLSGRTYTHPDRIYYGRGLVMITWYENYELLGRLIGVDILNHPEKALEMPVAVKILFEGMLRGSSSFGDFTGKCLEMYFHGTLSDWVNARRIINGLDRAEYIAQIAKDFNFALAA